MDSKWIKGLAGEEKERRVSEVKAHHRAFSDLREILEKEWKNPKESDYESPSWAFKQADTIGFNRALTTVLNLIKE